MSDPRWAEFVGREMPPGRPLALTAEAIKKFAESVGDTRPEYLNGSVAPPAFANHIFVKSLGGGIAAMKGLIKNPMMVLHTGETYEYLGPVKAGDTLTTGGRIKSVEERNNMLWVAMENVARNQEGRDVLRAVMTLGVRAGGY
ncbi:MAG: MaoC family dehydratase N-terminal domain-containing protein [Halobacteria archaeon]